MCYSCEQMDIYDPFEEDEDYDDPWEDEDE